MSAIAPNIVPPAVLPRAIAMSSIAWQSASVVGPAAGGLIYAAHPASVYIFAAVLLAISAFTISRVRPVLPPPVEVRRHPLREMVEVVEKHGAMILVDESHSLGTHGPEGAGLKIGHGPQQVTVITPRSPLGQVLIGKRLDDEVSLVVAGVVQVSAVVAVV